jgi:hypothetical protein
MASPSLSAESSQKSIEHELVHFRERVGREHEPARAFLSEMEARIVFLLFNFYGATAFKLNAGY